MLKENIEMSFRQTPDLKSFILKEPKFMDL